MNLVENITGQQTEGYDSFFYEAAQTYNVPAALLIAMGKVESDFNPNVVSGAGASGIMQLMPSTAASLGVSNVFDPRENIMGGAKYVSQLIEQFKGYSNGLELAIAGYNAGPGAVMKYGCKPEKEDYPGSIRTILGTGEQSPFYMGKQEEIGWNGRFMKNGLILPCTGR